MALFVVVEGNVESFIEARDIEEARGKVILRGQKVVESVHAASEEEAKRYKKAVESHRRNRPFDE